MTRIMSKEVPSKFDVQHDELEKEVEKYKQTLPAGIVPSENFMIRLRGKPHRILLKVRQNIKNRTAASHTGLFSRDITVNIQYRTVASQS